MARTEGLFLVAAVLISMIGGCGPSARRSWTQEDPWYTGPPAEGVPYWTWEQVDGQLVHEVAESKAGEAEKMLEYAPLIPICSEQAGELIAWTLSDLPGRQTYLVRGLLLDRGGRFSVYAQGQKLAVHHGTLGSGPRRMQRQALVVQLDQAPAEVYVFCSMAQ